MRSIVQVMLNAQRTLLRASATAPEHQALLADLRQQVHDPVLAHYLRRVEQGSKGVAEVRNGICSGCHMRLPSGVLGALMKPHDLLLCETCGAYLYLPDEEVARLLPARPVARRAKARPAAVRPAA